MWRVPNSTANTAIDSATIERHVAEQRLRDAGVGVEWAMMVSSDNDTALSCSAM